MCFLGRQLRCLVVAGLDILGLQVLERGHRHIGHVSVQLVGGVLIVVAATRQAHANAEWSGPDTLGPDVLVQTGVDPHIGGAHLPLGELADLLDGAGRALLEANVVDTLGQVNGALARHDFVDRGFVDFLTLGLGHCAV